MAENKRQVTVIGGGPGGYAAAFLAADLDMDVTLIDPEENPGGICLYRGCIPSKALLHLAKLISETKDAESWGLKYPDPEIDIDKIRSWKNDVVGKLTGGLGQLSKRRNVNHIRGTARFKDSKNLEIDLVNGETQSHSFKNAIIATGSYPAKIPNLAPDSPKILDSTTALELEDIPKSLLVVGGGYIGLELGTVYASLGTKVTVVEMMPGILPGVDRDLVAQLFKRLDGLFESVMVSTTVTETKEQKNGIKVTLKSEDDETQDKIFDKVLISVGRKPNSANLGLENTGVELDDKGFVKVDAHRRTTDDNIFAIGDIAGEPMLAHKASHEGRAVVEFISGRDVDFSPRAIPAVVFTDPEIAWCGMTEEEAKNRNREVDIVKFPWAASGRAATIGRSDGVTKLIIDTISERILGVGIAGPGAGELIAEGVLAIEMAAVASDLRFTIHPHPTLSETLMETADVLYGQSTHYYRPRRK
ncbi:MAG: dihydrolipoyl dehydrogenase [candidate division Zixibacteria bacterium]|nr:dihydrolipoyl dehydrogenase [candidate division Zixibacteria bacterium]